MVGPSPLPATFEYSFLFPEQKINQCYRCSTFSFLSVFSTLPLPPLGPGFGWHRVRKEAGWFVLSPCPAALPAPLTWGYFPGAHQWGQNGDGTMKSTAPSSLYQNPIKVAPQLAGIPGGVALRCLLGHLSTLPMALGAALVAGVSEPRGMTNHTGTCTFLGAPCIT